MKEHIKLITELDSKFINLWLDSEGKLRYKAPEGVMTPDLLGKIKQYKTEIINSLKNNTTELSPDFPFIPKISRTNLHPVSYSQKRFLFLHELEGENTTYNVFGGFNLSGQFSIPIFQSAINYIIEKHEVLRTTFKKDGKGDYYQEIHPILKLTIQEISLQKIQGGEVTLEQFLKSEYKHVFDIKNGPLLKISIVNKGNNEYLLIIVLHHIITDGWSLGLFMKELSSIYSDLCQQKSISINTSSIQYVDYTHWQLNKLKRGGFDNQLNYWKKNLEGIPEQLNLPIDKERLATQTSSGNIQKFTINEDQFKKIKNVCRTEGVSVYIFLLTHLAAFLSKITQEEDIIIGSPVANRVNDDLETLMGCLINFISLRINVKSNGSIQELLNQVKQVSFDAFNNQDVPFDQVVEYINPKRILNLSPIFQIDFTYQNLGNERIHLPNVVIEPLEIFQETSKYDLSFIIQEHESSLQGIIEYKTDIFTDSTISKLMIYYQDLLTQIIENPNLHLSEIVLGGKKELEWVEKYNSVSAVYSPQKSVVDVFEKTVSDFEKNTAIVYRNKQLSYLELNQLANRLANHLIQQYKVKKGSHIGIMLNKSDYLIVAIMAVLKTGAVYIPVDAATPLDRNLLILNETNCKTIITESAFLFDLDAPDISLFAIDIQLDTLKESNENLTLNINGDDLAYVMYTSGSTGKPKGVMVPNNAIVRLVNNTNYIQIQPEDKVLNLSNYNFDGSTFDIFGALLNGATLVIPSKQGPVDLVDISNEIKNNNITVFFITTALFNALVDHEIDSVKDVRKILFGGEKVSVKHVNSFIKKHGPNRLIHVYGPTENTTFSTYYHVNELAKEGKTIPIGYPISNTEIYIITKDNSIQSRGLKGEICLSGLGLAQGYFQDKLLTNEKFIKHPVKPGKLLYKTGDIGLMLEDGSIEFIGRNDDQVKLRGYRIELGDIESAIKRLEFVKEAIVLFKEDDHNNPYLIVYYSASKPLTSGEIKDYISNLLPEYMIPQHYVQLEKFKLNSNGKIEKSSLFDVKDLNLSSSKTVYEPASSILEIQLVSIVEENLAKTNIGVTTNYFGLGGDSIKAIRLISNINNQLNKKLEVKDIFNHQTVRELANYLENGFQQSTDKIKLLQEAKQKIELLKKEIETNVAYKRKLPDIYEDLYPMGAIQQGMLFHSLTDKKSGIYHDQIFHELIDPDFNYEIFKRAYSLMVEKHSIFRTSLHLQGFQEPIQVVYKSENVEFDIPLTDLTDKEKDQQQKYLKSYLKTDREKGFLSEKPGGLWRTALFKLSSDCYSILRIFHHAILDGWSDASFITELTNIYFELKKNSNYYPQTLKCSYKDYIIDQESIMLSSNAKTFWKEKLAGYERTDLPFHKKNESNLQQTKEIKKRTDLLIIDKSLEQDILKLANEEHISLKQFFLSALCFLLKLTTNSNDITFGTITNGRPGLQDGDKLIGCFLNTIPFRIVLEKNITGRRLLNQIRELEINHKEYEKLPFPAIINEIGEVAGNRNPVSDLIFGFLDFHIYNTEGNNNLKTGSIESGFAVTNTLFDIIAIHEHGGLKVAITTLEDLYSEDELTKIKKYYLQILKLISQSPDKIILHNEILSEQEIIEELNFSNHQQISVEKTHENIIENFRKNINNYSKNIALEFNDKKITYSELEEKSNQLAHFLVNQQKVTDKALIGLVINKSIEMIVAIIGILKAGATYVPINPNYPDEKITYILKDSDIKLIVTDQPDLVKKHNVPYIDLNFENESLINQPKKQIESAFRSSDHIAYIIYTSGTTGKPKGVIIQDKGVVNLTAHMQHELQITENSRVLQFASSSFDASVWEIFGTLLNGGCLVLASEMDLLPGLNLSDTLAKKNISHVTLPPSLLSILDHTALGNLKNIIVAGEFCPPHIIEKWSANRNFFNAYGPTETTVCATIAKMGKQDKAGIGNPILNTEVYVLSNSGELIPNGVKGEMHIGGLGLAKGYLNNPELTNQKFIHHPFYPGERLYKTGDMARRINNGELIYEGRKDQQIKIRGYRIEIGEIEFHLNNHPLINQSSVICKRKDLINDRLIAFIVKKENEEIDLEDIRLYLTNKLPNYMIPSSFHFLPELPFTSNGKIDKSALHEFEIETEKGFSEPENNIETTLLLICKEILKLEKISTTENLFELGSNSISATRIILQINEHFKTNLTIDIIFNMPNIKQLAEYINSLYKIKENSSTVDLTENNLEEFEF